MTSHPELPELERCAVFGGLAPEELAHVAARFREERHPAGARIVTEGEPAERMYVLREGEVEVLKGLPAGGEERLAVLGPGDCFGEMALIDIQPRSASVRALGPAVALSLSNADLRALLGFRPAAYALIVGNLAREISRRLRRNDALAAEALLARRDRGA